MTTASIPRTSFQINNHHSLSHLPEDEMRDQRRAFKIVALVNLDEELLHARANGDKNVLEGLNGYLNAVFERVSSMSGAGTAELLEAAQYIGDQSHFTREESLALRRIAKEEPDRDLSAEIRGLRLSSLDEVATHVRHVRDGRTPREMQRPVTRIDDTLEPQIWQDHERRREAAHKNDELAHAAGKKHRNGDQVKKDKVRIFTLGHPEGYCTTENASLQLTANTALVQAVDAVLSSEMPRREPSDLRQLYHDLQMPDDRPLVAANGTPETGVNSKNGEVTGAAKSTVKGA